MAARPSPKRPARPAAPPQAESPSAKPLALVYLLGWLVPGGGHLWLGRTAKGAMFLVMLPLMFVIGLALEGRLFPFTPGEPLVALAAIANIGSGLPYFIAQALGAGAGRAVAVTYEYGNAFLITAGLLNALVIIDAHDIALGAQVDAMDTASHLLLMALFAGCVAVVGGVLLKDTPRQQARSAAEIFGSLVGAALVLGWVLYFFPNLSGVTFLVR